MCSGEATSIKINREVLEFTFGNSRFRQKVNYVKHMTAFNFPSYVCLLFTFLFI